MKICAQASWKEVKSPYLTRWRGSLAGGIAQRNESHSYATKPFLPSRSEPFPPACRLAGGGLAPAGGARPHPDQPRLQLRGHRLGSFQRGPPTGRRVGRSVAASDWCDQSVSGDGLAGQKVLSIAHHRSAGQSAHTGHPTARQVGDRFPATSRRHHPHDRASQPHSPETGCPQWRPAGRQFERAFLPRLLFTARP